MKIKPKSWDANESKLYFDFFCKKMNITGEEKKDLWKAVQYCENQQEFINYISPFYNTKITAKPIENEAKNKKPIDIKIKVVK